MELGRAVGAAAQPDEVYMIEGPVGAGKTQLVKGIAQGIGYHGRVRSPSFALLNVYEGGRAPIYHFDLYRVEDAAAQETLELERYFESGGILLIEWANYLKLPAPETRRTLILEPISDSERQITYVGFSG